MSQVRNMVEVVDLVVCEVKDAEVDVGFESGEVG